MKSPSTRVPLALRLAVRLLPEDAREDVLGDLLEKWHSDICGQRLGARIGWLSRQPVTALGLRLQHPRTSEVRRSISLIRKAGLGVSLLDVRLGLRALRRHPTVTAVTGLALALGIPVGLFPSHMSQVWMQSLPVDEGEQIQVIRYSDPSTGDYQPPSLADLARWLGSLGSFEAIGAASMGSSYSAISRDGVSAPVQGATVSASVFEMLRVAPMIGRALIPADEAPTATDVVVIGYDLWRSRFASDPEIVGTPLRVAGVDRVIVGVMPEGFRYPYRDDLWLPLRMTDFIDQPGEWEGASRLVFGRLADGIDAARAEREIVAAHQALIAEAPEEYAHLHPEVVPFGAGTFNVPAGGYDSDPEYYAIQLLFVLILVVACTNVGMLTLARTVTRSSEIAIRTALGAGRARIVSQLFVEALVLAVLAAGFGLLVGDQVVLPAMGWLLDRGPAWLDVGVTPTTVLWAMSLAVLSGAVVGIVPALKATSPAVNRNIQRASAGRSGVRFGGLSSALLVADVALAVSVVGLTVYLWGQVGEGSRRTALIPAEEILSAELSVPRIAASRGAAGFDPAEFSSRLGETQREVLRRLRSEPGVREATAGSALVGLRSSSRIELDDGPGGGTIRRVMTANVDPSFMGTLGQPILSGRGFTPRDAGDDGLALIANSTFVREVLLGSNAVGRRVRFLSGADADPGPWHEIVGVVEDIGMSESSPKFHQGLYRAAVPEEIYPARLAIRLSGDPASFVPRLREITSDVDPAAMIQDVRRLDEVVLGNRMVWLMSIGGIGFGLLILLGLSASGIYALMSFTVTQRTKEIGIRVALGAPRPAIVRIVATRSLAQIAGGVLLGIPFAAVALTQSAGVQDLVRWEVLVSTLTIGGSVALVIGLIACAPPALRALRIAPDEALRQD